MSALAMGPNIISVPRTNWGWTVRNDMPFLQQLMNLNVAVSLVSFRSEWRIKIIITLYKCSW